MTTFGTKADAQLIEGLGASPFDMTKVYAAIDAGADVNGTVFCSMSDKDRPGVKLDRLGKTPLLAYAALITEQRNFDNSAVFALLKAGADATEAKKGLTQIHRSEAWPRNVREMAVMASGRIMDMEDHIQRGREKFPWEPVRGVSREGRRKEQATDQLQM